MRRLILSLPLILCQLPPLSQPYNLVIKGGRAHDQGTGLNALATVGVTQGRMRKMSGESLDGKRVISARGLVVAPGFIDLHQHGQDLESQRVKALDGVTTALELEIGKPDVGAFLQAKKDRSLINYGTA